MQKGLCCRGGLCVLFPNLHRCLKEMSSSTEPQTLLETAILAAQKAGAYLMENFGRLAPSQIVEKAANDFVSHVDQTSEKIILDLIRARHPGHAILAEEGGNSGAAGPYQWLVDPLDGTTNFVREIPFFSVSIAVRKENHLLAGVVFNPVQNELFAAARRAGATLNNRPIQVSTQSDLRRAFLATGFPHHAKFHLPDFIRAFTDIYYHSAGVRRLGSAALDLCYTACGRFDGFWETELSPWDLAAGSLIVQEAGGQVSDFWGREDFLQNGFVIAAPTPIHHHLTTLLTQYFRGWSHE